MSLLLFNIVSLALVGLDTRTYPGRVAPLMLLGSIFTILIDINNLIATSVFGFYPISDYVLMILIFFFISIFVVDLFFGSLYSKGKATRMAVYPTVHRFRNFRVLLIAYAIGSISYLIQFIRLYKSFGLDIKGLNDGILGHLSSLAFVLGPVILDVSIKRKERRISLILTISSILLLMISILFGGKYIVFINATYFVLYFYISRKRGLINKKAVLSVISFIVLATFVFYIIYYIIPEANGSYIPDVQYVFRHFFEYLLGPLVANNYSMSHPGLGSPLIPFTVLINIIKAISQSGSYISSVFNFVFPIGLGQYTNVSGFFGELVFCEGFAISLIYTIVFFTIVNSFLLSYYTTGKYRLTSCYLLSIIIFLFFGNFLTVSGVILKLILAIVLDILSTVRINEFHI